MPIDSPYMNKFLRFDGSNTLVLDALLDAGFTRKEVEKFVGVLGQYCSGCYERNEQTDGICHCENDE